MSATETQAPRISTVILRVADLDRALSLYEGVAGLPVISRAPSFAFLDLGGGVSLALNQIEGGDPGASASTTELVLEVGDLGAIYAAWSAAGVAFEVAPRPVVETDGRVLEACHFRDEDGHLVSVTAWRHPEGAIR